MLKIGNKTYESEVVVAPMAGVTDGAFRTILGEMAPALIYTEMISSDAIYYGNEKTLAMLNVEPHEKHIALQLFGFKKDMLAYATKYVCDHVKNIDTIDLNMGCPVPKVVKSGAGSALMQNEDHAAELVGAMVEVSSVPITVKIRSGWDKQHINAVSLAKKLEAAGASAIAVHGRTRVQMYRKYADWDIIRQVKEAVNIPVIGNGDVKTPDDAKKMLEETGVDAVMVGRALQGNPWLIREIHTYLKDGHHIKAPTLEERLDMIKRHAELLIREKGNKVALLEMRSHAAWYLKGIKHAAMFRRELSRVDSLKSLKKTLNELNDMSKSP
ncbi:MAG: tRNA dihydrouridine synthase DusB [Bacillota bacterium]